MDSKLFLLSFFFLFSSSVSLGLSPNLDQQGGGGGGRDDSLPCLPKLMPCRPYLKSVSSSPPPSTCCAPLKDMVLNDSECLCKIFNNPQLLGRLNITQEDALKLTKACGAIIDLVICKQIAESSGPPAAPATPSSSSSASNSTNIKSAANWNFPLGVSSFITLLVVNLGLISQSIQCRPLII